MTKEEIKEIIKKEIKEEIIKELKDNLLVSAIFNNGEKEIKITNQNKSKGEWIVKKSLEAIYKVKDGKSATVIWDYNFKRFEIWIANGSGRDEIFYEDEIPLIKEAGKMILEMRKLKKLPTYSHNQPKK